MTGCGQQSGRGRGPTGCCGGARVSELDPPPRTQHPGRLWSLGCGERGPCPRPEQGVPPAPNQLYLPQGEWQLPGEPGKESRWLAVDVGTQQGWGGGGWMGLGSLLEGCDETKGLEPSGARVLHTQAKEPGESGHCGHSLRPRSLGSTAPPA